jgi:hypothetical protein
MTICRSRTKEIDAKLITKTFKERTNHSIHSLNESASSPSLFGYPRRSWIPSIHNAAERQREKYDNDNERVFHYN